ncbi:MAG: endo-1,4-beta-xylanase [Planctomycetia bacterium]
MQQPLPMFGFTMILADRAAFDPPEVLLRHLRLLSWERIPLPITVEREGRRLVIRCDSPDSGVVSAAFEVEGFGSVVLETSSLMQREEPYRLAVELARGQLTILRNQLADWEVHGLETPGPAAVQLAEAMRSLRKAINAEDEEESHVHAHEVLRRTLWTAENLTQGYARRALGKRRKALQQPSPSIGCVVDPVFERLPSSRRFSTAFGHATLPVEWARMQSDFGACNWESLDQRVSWCKQNRLPCMLGPLIDLSPSVLAPVVKEWDGDAETIATLMVDFVESCVHRYKEKVKQWDVVARANSAEVLGLRETDLLWLSKRLLEAVRTADEEAAVSMTIDLPWCEYLPRPRRSYSPIAFLDMLQRMEAPLTRVNVEIAMGYPHGSHCRSLLAISRLLDDFHELDLPVRVRLNFPSQPAGTPVDYGGDGTDVGWGGRWHEQNDDKIQAEWAKKVVRLVLAKPFVDAVSWGQYHDWEGCRWPHSGLVAENGRIKPIFGMLQELCAKHLF